MGGHLVHLFEWLHKETEKGGILAVVGIAIGFFVGYVAKPVMHPSHLCQSTGLGQDVFGHCPDVFDGDRLVFVLVVGVVFGAVAIVIGWLLTGREAAE